MGPNQAGFRGIGEGEGRLGRGWRRFHGGAGPGADVPTTAFAWRPARCPAGFDWVSISYLPRGSSKRRWGPEGTCLSTR